MNAEILVREESWDQMVFKDLRVFLVHLVQMVQRYCTDESLLSLLLAMDCGYKTVSSTNTCDKGPYFINREVQDPLVRLVMLVLQVFRECQERGVSLALQVPKVKG